MKDGKKCSGEDYEALIIPRVDSLNGDYKELGDFDSLRFAETFPFENYTSLQDVLSLELDEYETCYGEETVKKAEFADEDEIDEDAGEVTVLSGKNIFRYVEGSWVKE